MLILFLFGVDYIALATANSTYCEHQQSGKSTEKSLINMAWAVKEFEDLCQSGRQLYVDVNCLLEEIENDTCNWKEQNIPQRFVALRKRIFRFITAVTRHKRTAATHILVFMISPEARNKKPYALPIQCIPYKGLSDAKVCFLANKVICKMTELGMKVAGLYISFCIIILKKLMFIVIHYRICNKWRVEHTTYKGKYTSIVHITDSC